MTEITQKQYDQIKDVLPVQRGNVRIPNLVFLNAIFYIAENGCKWRKLPETFGPWHTIYMRMRRWADNEVWPRVVEALRSELAIELEILFGRRTDITALLLDSTSVKVHPDGTGALKKTAHKPSAKVAAAGTRSVVFGFSGGHAIVANATTPIVFQLSPGSCHDDPEARKLIPKLPKQFCDLDLALLMDKAYEGDAVRALAVEQGLQPVVPPKSNRVEPWEYDVELYKRRNEVERFFRRLKAFRRVFTRYDKLDVMYASFVNFAIMCEFLRE